MTIRHLQIFIAVADCGRMRAAAEQLYISQPSESQAIREFEQYYDVKLFERLNQRIYITESGRKLLSYARHIVNSLDECEQELKKDKVHPLIRLGSSVSVGTVLLDDYLNLYEVEIPQADVRVTVNNTAQIEGLLLTNQLDLAIVEGSIDSEELIQIEVAEDELFLVVGRHHPYYENPNITLDQLNGQALISREEGSRDRNQYERLLRDKGIHMEKKWSCTNVQAIINSVMAGRGIGILSNLLIADELRSGELRMLNIDDIHIRRKLRLVYHKNKYLTDAMQQFIHICTEN